MNIRKISTFVDTVYSEAGKALETPLKLCVAAAVIKNPWVGRDVADLSPEVQAQAPELALLLTEEIITAFGSAEAVEAFGKGAIVGTDGELEHGAAFLHTPFFGNVMRERLNSNQWISYADVRGAAGIRLTIPMADTVTSGKRTHFITHSFSIVDAPAADELVIAMVASTGGRPFARIGDRTTDPKVTLADFADRAKALGITI